ncbi:hypothetical protein NDU88_005504 [Pleurodeles waltl]|uniref:Uncharacterized protein n=1 Tax=Pleurodeles waltl TaxID=8319 RepID=A0AAV7UMA8_PLEWA|nr:hypothetical protein NDU88_005504 [Pleurodeles waltl]
MQQECVRRLPPRRGALGAPVAFGGQGRASGAVRCGRDGAVALSVSVPVGVGLQARAGALCRISGMQREWVRGSPPRHTGKGSRVRAEVTRRSRA